MKKSDIKVGQNVYVRPMHGKEEIIEAIVTKIGVKYFDVKVCNNIDIKFNLSDLREKHTGYGCGYNYVFYFSKQEYFDELEKRRLYNEVYKEIKYSTEYTLDQLRRIKAILEEKNEINHI